jgi:hypothetical protein
MCGMDLAAHLDTQLTAWLEWRAAAHWPERPDLTATALITVNARFAADVERFATGWGMTVRRAGPDVLVVDGRRLPVLGFAEIAAAGLPVPAAPAAPAPARRARMGDAIGPLAALSVAVAFAFANALTNR